MVVFRSTVWPEADRVLMRELDDNAHAEAELSGGLLEYVAGSDAGARASVCVWETKEDAKRASQLPAHRLAASHATDFYEVFTIQTYVSADE